jgi:hypothetical protein
VKRIKFTIGTLLIVVLFLGLCFAALKQASDTWDGGILGVTIGLLLVSILLAVHRVGEKRAYWLGFALFGATYLGLTFVPAVESRLSTTQALKFLDSKIPGRPIMITGEPWGSTSNTTQVIVNTTAINGNVLSGPNQGQTVALWNVAPGPMAGTWAGTSENFIRIGHSLVSWLAAWAGGLVSRAIYARNRELSTPSREALA